MHKITREVDNSPKSVTKYFFSQYHIIKKSGRTTFELQDVHVQPWSTLNLRARQK